MNEEKAQKRLLVINVAGLSYQLASASQIPVLQFKPLTTSFPALTCSVQAVFRTASPATANNMPANGFFERSLQRPFFWEQAAALVTGERIWKAFRQQGGKVGLFFWQQSLGEAADVIISPAPIHKHHGGMIQDCYSTPVDLYPWLCAELGRPFDLMHYWGPFASYKSSLWITEATCALLHKPELAPELLFVYLPLLDYDLQRFGPASEEAQKALQQLSEQLQSLTQVAAAQGYELLVFGDYALETVTAGPLYPNRLLRQQNFFKVRNVKKLHYPDFYECTAFAIVDHEVAHIYSQDPALLPRLRELFCEVPNVGEILDKRAQQAAGLACARAGDLVLTAKPGSWFAYPWWEKEESAPEYARHVDIHNKPGYDPGELFQGWPPFNISLKAEKIKGSHGLNTADRATCWAFTGELSQEPTTLLELAREVKQYLTH